MMLSQSVERAAQVNATGIATIFKGRRQSWAEFRDRVARLAGVLRSRGVAPGDRVAVLGLNSDAYLEALYAVWWAGGVVVPMNIRWSAAEHGWSLTDSGACGLLVDENFTDLLPAITPDSVADVIAIGDWTSNPSSVAMADELIAATKPLDPYHRDPGELAGIYYTGGTTGRPKGVMLSELALWSSAMSVALAIKLDPDVRYLHAAPAFHLGDGGMMIAVTIAAATHVLIPMFRPEETLEIVAREKISIALLVPTMIRMLIDSPAFDATKLNSLKVLAYGASPMPLKTLEDARASFPACEFINSYGQTELAPVAAVLHERDYPPGEGARPVGRAAYCVTVKISDDDGRELPRGETGEIWVRGPNAMLGYWNNPELSAQQISNGWIRTGDVGHMDEQGFIFISDRKKDMIISGGENIFSVEVEDALLGHSAVREAAVIGVPDPVYGERVHAVVVVADIAAVDGDALAAHCRARIAGYKVPRSFTFRTEPLPLSAAGKPLKTDLRALVERDRAWNAPPACASDRS
jgi:long-chain acyl-CoA synthetase